MEISVIMPSYNAGKYIKDTIDSVLRQSYEDFEFVIVDDGSTDRTRDIIRSYSDERIRLIENKHNFIDTINKGLFAAKGKYIACMDNDDIMHIDRLKIEYAIMEKDPKITVCSSNMKTFGEVIPAHSQLENGVIADPLLKFINGDYIANPTAMIRAEFIRNNNLMYKNYSFAADYKFWVDVAKAGGVFYIESQSLVYYRIAKTQASQKYKDEQQEASTKIRYEIIEYLINKNIETHPQLKSIYGAYRELEKNKLLTESDILLFFIKFFTDNKDKLITG